MTSVQHDQIHRLARHYLEPGPVVLISSRYGGTVNVMTCGWHQMLGWSRMSCLISPANHSHAMIRESGVAVINVPAADMLDTLVDIGNCSGADTDKFARFGLERETAQVDAPGIAQCWAQLDCRITDPALIERYDLFVFDVVAIRAVPGERPQTAHYLGDGEFLLSGRTVSKRERFRPEMLL
ncbi:flavin reductase family protein [Stakelama tenebrarum]|uniref:Flavin reductase family protein n=1 Tax=Stakelama tenebrarum TaxID=2711215 RepID=A0A6G6Y1X3_9SPHN|nr:flavin reductase family protein [Sphingosinithalassobacter tenebrarum]QIG78944.1 flavin reductase family protein [Sphingosinithalassobacter tenebrarum]